MLDLDGVSVERGDARLLDAVSASFPAGVVAVVAGPSGAGKSTLLRLCNRLEVPSSGRVLFEGRDVRDLDPLALRRRVGMVFQRPAVFPGTVRDNLQVAAPRLGERDLAAALHRVSLDPGLLDRDALTLSGGEAQRLCLARTLVTAPEALLLDEPTSSLDAGPRKSFERLACGLADDGMAVVWVSHDADQVERIAQRLLVLVAGTVRYEGDPAGLDPGLRRSVLEGEGEQA
jgi:putative ABC transport system ATP-binding protein